MSQESQLCAGAARVDITPEMGIQLAGDIGRKRPVEEIRERLYASALAVEYGGESLCVLSLDLLAMSCAWSDRIRQGAAERYGLRPEAIMVHVVQNHAAPSLGHLFLVDEKKTRFPPEYPWLMGGDDRYNEPTVASCIEAIGQAVRNLEPVTLAVGHGVDGRVAFNRRFVMRDGTTRCHPAWCDPNILHVEGPTDPEVAVVTFTNAEGKVVAALLHHTCHPGGAWCRIFKCQLSRSAPTWKRSGALSSAPRQCTAASSDRTARRRAVPPTGCRMTLEAVSQQRGHANPRLLGLLAGPSAPRRPAH